MSAELALPGLPLRAEKVTAGYGGDPVIRDITLSADPGEVVSLVGPNGSGKSTLLKSLAGVVHVSSGTVRVGDRDLTNSAPEEIARAAVGYVPQVDDIFSPLSVRENLEMGGYLLRRSQVAGTRRAGAGHLPPARRACSAAAPGSSAAASARCWPWAGCSCSTRACSCSTSRPPTWPPSSPPRCSPSTSASWPTSGAAVLIVEQRAKAVLAISDRSYVLGGGEVRMQGTPAELSGRPDFVESFLGGRGAAAAPSGDA